MKTMQFIQDYLKPEAIITISNNEGSILFEGEAKNAVFVRSVLDYSIVSKIEGLGSLNDICIEVEVL